MERDGENEENFVSAMKHKRNRVAVIVLIAVFICGVISFVSMCLQAQFVA